MTEDQKDHHPPAYRARRPTGRGAWIIAGAIVVAALVIGAGLFLSRSGPVPAGAGRGSPFSGAEGDFDDFGLNARAYASVEEMLDAMTRGGVTCSRLQAKQASEPEKESASCQANDDDVLIRIFADVAQRNRYLEDAQGLLARANVSALPRIVGPTWFVTTDTKATARRLQGALGGQVL